MIKGSSVLVSKLYIQPYLANAKQMNSCFWVAEIILTPGSCLVELGIFWEVEWKWGVKYFGSFKQTIRPKFSKVI